MVWRGARCLPLKQPIVVRPELRRHSAQDPGPDDPGRRPERHAGLACGGERDPTLRLRPLHVRAQGATEDVRQKAMRPLRDALSDESYTGLLGTTDSETIFAGLLDRLRENSGDLGGATTETIRHVSGICAKLGVRATLNLAVTDGTAITFARHSSEGPGNSLVLRRERDGFPGGGRRSLRAPGRGPEMARGPGPAPPYGGRGWSFAAPAVRYFAEGAPRLFITRRCEHKRPVASSTGNLGCQATVLGQPDDIAL